MTKFPENEQGSPNPVGMMDPKRGKIEGLMMVVEKDHQRSRLLGVGLCREDRGCLALLAGFPNIIRKNMNTIP